MPPARVEPGGIEWYCLAAVVEVASFDTLHEGIERPAAHVHDGVGILVVAQEYTVALDAVAYFSTCRDIDFINHRSPELSRKGSVRAVESLRHEDQWVLTNRWDIEHTQEPC